MFLLSTHNICFGWVIRKIIFQYTLLSRGLLLESGILIVNSDGWVSSKSVQFVELKANLQKQKSQPFSFWWIFPNIVKQYIWDKPSCVLRGHRVKFLNFDIVIMFLKISFIFTDKTLKCSQMQHFIWVFTFCQSTCLSVFRIKRANIYL